MKTLEQKIEQLTNAFERFVAIHEQQTDNWIDPDKACRILGFTETKSGSHRRRLKQLEDANLLKKVRDGRPKKYWRKEVEELSYKLSRGRVII